MTSTASKPVTCTLPNPATTTLPDSTVHFLPFSITYSGPAHVDRFFHPEPKRYFHETLSPTGTLQEKPQPVQQYPTLLADFRGHLITGHKHPLPTNTIGLILETAPTSSSPLTDLLKSTASCATGTQNTQTEALSSQQQPLAPLPSLSIPQPTTTLRKRNSKATRSKQDMLFDDLDENGNLRDLEPTSQQQQLSQHLSSQLSISLSTQQQHLQQQQQHQQQQQQQQQSAKTVSVTGVFTHVHIWDPEVISDQSLFEYRRQPIDELIPLANALHCDSDDE